MIQIYDDLKNELVDFKPLEEGKVRMYVCGPTVYDSPHLGHARSAVAFDMIRKFLEYRGYNVKFIKNYTDVDDKMINRAYLRNISIQELAQQYIEEWEYMQEFLHIKKPTLMPRATQEIPAMIEMIQTLEKKDFAYNVDGSVYFDTSKMEGYKFLFRNQDDSDADADIDTDRGGPIEVEQDFSGSDYLGDKRNKEDFVLWKKQKPGEPAWDSPWGKGRPGWHIECSVMAMKYLGETIDIHGGGKDLKRPHHQNEIAQSESATGKIFCQYWMHNGFLNIDDEKMSKSLGNFIPFTEMMEKFPGELIRYYYIKHYYQRPMNFAMDKLEDAKKSLEKLHQFYLELKDYSSKHKSELESKVYDNQKQVLEEYSQAFFEAMDSDFNSAKAIGVLFTLVNHFSSIIHKNEPLSKTIQEELLTLWKGIDSFFNCLIPSENVLGESAKEWKNKFDSLVNAILEYRKSMKIEKNYVISDAIRDLLHGLGIVVNDEGNDFTWELE